MVICKFVHRKRMRAVITSRKKLKDTDLRPLGIQGKVVIFESMSHHYRNLNWKCTQLKKAGIVEKSWFTNGKYKIVMHGDDTPHIVVDLADVCEIIHKEQEDVDNICSEWKDRPFPLQQQRR